MNNNYDNYISLYTQAPSTTGSVISTFAKTPIIKLEIEWSGRNQFDKYNIPIKEDNLLRAYITYSVTTASPAVLYKKSIWNITGNTMGLSNIQSIYGNAIFEYKSQDDTEIPDLCYIDFSEFNKEDYYIKTGSKTSNTQTYNYTKYISAYLNSSNDIVRDYNIKPAEVAMRNFVWFNPDCTFGGNYICSDVLENYILSTNYLIPDSQNDITRKNYIDLINKTKEIIGSPFDYTIWPIDIIKKTNHTVLPVAVNGVPSKSLFNYDFENNKIFINGFNNLFQLSQYLKRDYINDDPYVYKFNLTNGLKSLLNPKGYFNIHETLPVRYKVKNINNSSNIFNLYQQFDNFPNTDKDNILWKTLRDNLQYKLSFTIASTSNKYSLSLFNHQFTSAYLNPFNDPNGFKFNASSLLYNNKSLDCTNIIQFAIPKSTQYNETVLLNDNINQPSRLELLFDYSNFKYKHKDDNKTYYGIEYNLNGNTNITYLDIVNKAYWCVSPYNIGAPSISDQVSIIPSGGLLFNEAITYKNPKIVTTCFTDKNNIDNSYINLNISYNYNYNGKEFTTTSIIPFIEANVPYNVQKIEFKINDKSIDINSSEARQFIDVYNTSDNTYYNVTSNYEKCYNNLNSILTPSKCVIKQNNKYNTYLLNISYYSYTNNQYNTNNIDIKLTANYITTTLNPVEVKHPYYVCEITYNKLNINTEDNVNIYIDDNQYLHINNLNYQNCSDETININFKLITPIPEYSTYYYFINNTTIPSGSLTNNTLIIGSNNIYNNYNDFSHFLDDSKEYFLKTDQSLNTYDYITIIPGSNTQINNAKYVHIFKPNQIFGIIADVTESGKTPITTKLNNDGNLILELPHYVNVKGKDAHTYLDVNQIVGDQFDNLINIGTYNTNVDQVNDLLSYYETAGKSEAYIKLHIDNNNEPLSILNDSTLFSNIPINIYTKFNNSGELIFDLSYINDKNLEILQSQTVKNDTFNICSVISSVSPGLTPELDSDIYFINKFKFNDGSLLNFDISINENNNTINFDSVSIVPNTEFTYLNQTSNIYNVLNTNYNYWLVKNRFINNNNNSAFDDIRNEILKNISLKYNKNMYLVDKYTEPIGIDIYFHNYVANKLNGSVYNYDYTNTYNGKSVSHYGFVEKLDLSKQIDNIKINNLYYRIYNRFNINININSKLVLQNDYIDIPVTTDISLTDIIKFNNSSYSSFVSALESTKKLLTSVIDNINITSTDKLKININNGWATDNTEIASGIRPITFNDINKDETVKYSFNDNIIIGSIDLSDIITVNEIDTIYIQPVYLGITSENINIWQDDKKISFNNDWANLLNYINNITTYDLSKYDILQITGFKLTDKLPNQNIKVVYQYGNQTGVTIDKNVKNTDISTGTEFKNEYNLYTSDNYLPLTLEDIFLFSNLPTIYNYNINLANQTVVLHYKLIKGVEEVESTIRFKITNNTLYSQVTKAAIISANNIVDFGTLYITDKNLTNIYNTEPGYLTFKSISSAKEDNYKVTISFCTDTEILPITYSFTVGDKDYNFGLKDYIAINKANTTSQFYDKDISYIMIKQILIDPDGSKKEADKYYLNID